jgi:hypothetical protein
MQTGSTYDTLTALPQDKWHQLIALGLAETDESRTPDGKITQYLKARFAGYMSVANRKQPHA